jgi:formylglycine-generating enzyme required for sulfatase activity
MRNRLIAIGIFLAALLAAHSARGTSAASQAAGVASALAAYTETLPDTTITFDMVPIPAGSFTMGSPDSEPGHQPDEAPPHQVSVAAFYIGAREVSWDEYDQFGFSLDLQRKRKLGLQGPKDAGDAVTRPTPPYADESWGWGKERQPVIGITQYAAAKYCEWLSARTGKHYRLPTEAEWEYAARAGTKTAYSFGADPAAIGDYAWYRANSEEQPHVGGQKKPNGWKLYDMHGNVAEWTADAYDKDFYAKAGSGSASAPFNDPGKALYPHVVRGGSWDDDPIKLRSAARRTSAESWSRRDPQNPKSLWWHTDATFVGFRVVREPDKTDGK